MEKTTASTRPGARTSVAIARCVPESWMLARLKRETEMFHRIADADRMSVMSANGREYSAFLARVYGFESPAEASSFIQRSAT